MGAYSSLLLTQSHKWNPLDNEIYVPNHSINNLEIAVSIDTHVFVQLTSQTAHE